MPRHSLTPEQRAKLEAQLQELYQVRASGASQVTYDGRSVTFKSDAALKQAIVELERKLYGRGRTRVLKFYPKRG